MQLINLISVFLVGVMSFIPVAYSAGELCSDIFALNQEEYPSFISRTLAEDIARLNPDFLKNTDSLESLYLLLREEHRKYDFLTSKAGQITLSPEMIARLQENYSDRYHLPPSSALTTFYTNILQGLYSKVAWAWKKKQIERLSGSEVSGKVLYTAQAILDGIYLPLRFTGDLHSNAEIQVFFESKTWEVFPWAAALTIVRRVHKEDIAFYEFMNWVERQKDLPPVSRGAQEIIMTALAKRNTLTGCCNSIGAPCLVCPLNLKFDKKRAK